LVNQRFLETRERIDPQRAIEDAEMIDRVLDMVASQMKN
jgi:hypothetical protein